MPAVPVGRGLRPGGSPVITSDPATCECRLRPWVTVDMLGGIRKERLTGKPNVKCPDTEHCLLGAPLEPQTVYARIGEHVRNIGGRCPWTGIRVAPARPCECGGWPWIQAPMLSLVIHKGLIRTNPITAAVCPGCQHYTEVERQRLAMHPRRARESCVWSGIYIATGTSVPPRGVSAPASTRA